MNIDSKNEAALERKYVQGVTTSKQLDKKVAWAEVKVGDILIRGIHVWRSGNGRLRVHFPSYCVADRIWIDTVVVPDEIRSEIEAEVIAAYREQKRKEDAMAKHEQQ